MLKQTKDSQKNVPFFHRQSAIEGIVISFGSISACMWMLVWAVTLNATNTSIGLIIAVCLIAFLYGTYEFHKHHKDAKLDDVILNVPLQEGYLAALRNTYYWFTSAFIISIICAGICDDNAPSTQGVYAVTFMISFILIWVCLIYGLHIRKIIINSEYK